MAEREGQGDGFTIHCFAPYGEGGSEGWSEKPELRGLTTIPNPGLPLLRHVTFRVANSSALLLFSQSHHPMRNCHFLEQVFPHKVYGIR